LPWFSFVGLILPVTAIIFRRSRDADPLPGQLRLLSDSAFLESCWLYVQSPAKISNKQICINAIKGESATRRHERQAAF
jgi:hypothetical protein